MKENISMKRLLTLVFVAVMVFACNAVYANDTAAATSEAPIVVGPHGYYGGFGHHGLQYGDQFDGMPGQKVNILTKIGKRLKSARAAMEARRASRNFGGGYDNGYFAPKRKRFAPRGNYGFGGGFHNHHGYQEFPAEFQVGGYY
jgi:hypothetical protein